jgi:hypothetical protein
MTLKGISQTSMPNPKYILQKKELTNSIHLCVLLIWKYESFVLLKLHNTVWKYVFPYADS